MPLLEELTKRIRELDQVVKRAIREKRLLTATLKAISKNAVPTRRGHPITPAIRRKIAAAQKKRWSQFRKTGK